MRIAVSGTACQGKSTFIADFQAEWPAYKTPEKTYRDIIKDRGHSDKATEDLQMDIINFMIDDLQKARPRTKHIWDRCPLDALVYSLWAYWIKIKPFRTWISTTVITASNNIIISGTLNNTVLSVRKRGARINNINV